MILNTLLKRLLKFIFNSSYILLLIYILDGMIFLNKFVSQWRKFEIKKSYIFKDIDFRIFWIFLDFSIIYFDFYRFNSFYKWQKGGYFPARTAS